MNFVPGVVIYVAVLSRVWLGIAAAQELTLTQDSEESFRRFMQLAQQGELGADVHNVNIRVDGVTARIELVRDGAPGKVLVLGPKRSAKAASRYFDITPGDEATATDVAAVGRALDRCFLDDPFQFAGIEESLASGPPPSFRDAWAYGGWRGLLRVGERRLMAPASLEYTVAMIAALAVGFTMSVLVLWSAPPSSRD